MSQSSSKSNGIGILGFLFLIFLTLKLAEVGAVARWSWWWVTSPLWAPLVLALAIGATVFVGLHVGEMVRTIDAWRTRRARLAQMMREDQ